MISDIKTVNTIRFYKIQFFASTLISPTKRFNYNSFKIWSAQGLAIPRYPIFASWILLNVFRVYTTTPFALNHSNQVSIYYLFKFFLKKNLEKIRPNIPTIYRYSLYNVHIFSTVFMANIHKTLYSSKNLMIFCMKNGLGTLVGKWLEQLDEVPGSISLWVWCQALVASVFSWNINSNILPSKNSPHLAFLHNKNIRSITENVIRNIITQIWDNCLGCHLSKRRRINCQISQIL